MRAGRLPDLHEVGFQREDQAAAADRLIRQEERAKRGSFAAERFHALRVGKRAKRRREQVEKVALAHDQNLRAAHVPQGVSRVAQGGEAHLPPADLHPHGNARAPHALRGGGAEREREESVGDGGAQKERFRVDLREEEGRRGGERVSCEEGEEQHAPRKAAGEQKEEQDQTQTARLALKGERTEEGAEEELSRRGGEEGTPREAACRGVKSAEESAEGVPSAPQRKPREARRCEKEQIIRRGVEEENAVEIHDRHDLSPLLGRIISRRKGEKASQKGRKKDLRSIPQVPTRRIRSAR